MRIDHARQLLVRPVIRRAYDFGKERVHLAVDPARGDPLPQYRCDSCDRDLLAGHFRRVAMPSPVGSRVSRFKCVAALHPVCNLCRGQQRGKHVSHRLYSPSLDQFFTKLVEGSRGGARTRGILFAIDKDDALGMFLDCDGICPITGITMDWQTLGNRERNGRNYKAPSLDRIDSAGNYVLGNVQVVTQVVNIMKNDLPLDMFVALCRKIAEHNVTL